MSNCKTPLLYPLVQHPFMEGFVAKQDMPIYIINYNTIYL